LLRCGLSRPGPAALPVRLASCASLRPACGWPLLSVP